MSIDRPTHFLSVKLPILDMGEVAYEEQESVHAGMGRLAGESVEIHDELRILKTLEAAYFTNDSLLSSAYLISA